MSRVRMPLQVLRQHAVYLFGLMGGKRASQDLTFGKTIAKRALKDDRQWDVFFPEGCLMVLVESRHHELVALVFSLLRLGE